MRAVGGATDTAPSWRRWRKGPAYLAGQLGAVSVEVFY